jgi:DNA segregation ATPase FtsK/SpoIIIE-like protein
MNEKHDVFAEDYMIRINRIDRKVRALNRYITAQRDKALTGEDITNNDRLRLSEIDAKFGEFLDDINLNPFNDDLLPSGQSKDSALLDALKICIKCGEISPSILQDKLHIGYAKARRLLEELANDNSIEQVSTNHYKILTH